MYRLEIGKRSYRYLVGSAVVAIITPEGKKYLRKLNEIQSSAEKRIQNGTSDGRLSPDEVADYILKNGIR